MSERTVIELRLEQTIRNGMVLVVVAYLIGLLGGWSISSMKRGLPQALAGLAISMAGMVICLRVWWRSKGSL